MPYVENLKPLGVVELLDCTDKTGIAFLDQIQKGHLRTAVLASNRDDQTKVGSHKCCIARWPSQPRTPTHSCSGAWRAFHAPQASRRQRGCAPRRDHFDRLASSTSSSAVNSGVLAMPSRYRPTASLPSMPSDTRERVVVATVAPFVSFTQGERIRYRFGFHARPEESLRPTRGNPEQFGGLLVEGWTAAPVIRSRELSG